MDLQFKYLTFGILFIRKGYWKRILQLAEMYFELKFNFINIILIIIINRKVMYSK